MSSMRTPRNSKSRSFKSAHAFTLIELIGVMAIMAILASVVTPNILRSIERAAASAEADTMKSLGDSIRSYLRVNTTMPPAATWNTALASFSDIPSAQITTNKRNMTRLYVVDPVAPQQRVLLLSSMRPNLALPTSGNISANFQTVWNTPANSIPTSAGWAAWNAQPNSSDFLVIERVNLEPIYKTDLLVQSYSLTFNNLHATTTVSYRITIASTGVTQALVTLAPTAPPSIVTLHAKDRIDFYRDGTGTAMDYSYVVSTSTSTTHTFDFDATLAQWMPR